MATATAVEIPENLWEGVDRHVRAWQARAVLLPMASRLAATNIAARLGVFSNEALVDFYSRLVEDESAPEAATEKAQAMRSEERRVGKEGVSTGRSRWWPIH